MGALAAGFALLPGTSIAQPFGPGPSGTIPGTSMAGQPIAGAPPRPRIGIPNAEIFGDTNAERRYGKPFDDSYLRPEVPRLRPGNSASERAVEGRSDLNGISADIYSRQGPAAIGGSAITRGRSEGRRAHPAEGGRAIIRKD